MNGLANNSLNAAHRRIPAWARILPAAAIIALALYFLFHYLDGLNRKDFIGAVTGYSAKTLWACATLTGISFLALGGYDIIAVRLAAARKPSAGRAWLAGAVANAISNAIGFHVLTATAVRYRLLSRSGLTGPEVAGVTALSWTALGFGFASMFSLAITASPLAGPWQRVGGLLMLGLLLLCARWLEAGKIIRLGQYSLRLPSGRLALAQMALGAVEMASAISALYVLMPAGAAPSFAAFSTHYIGAVLLGIASTAPGGLGVFEAAMLAFSNGQNRAGILAALLLYRLIYNLGPFLLGALVLAGDELRAALSSKADNA